jgi:tRNA (cytidine/uridine-2'-O-)-methyltransferase
LIVALWSPEIPGNTGSIGRLCAANGIPLWIVGKPLFEISDRSAQRAGLDYWDQLEWRQWDNPEEFIQQHADRCCFFTKRSNRLYFDRVFSDRDILVFGPESKGLPSDVLLKYPDQTLRLPQRNNAVRSLNLAQCVAAVVYEGLRQQYLRGAHVNTPFWST